jgi:hypothetical protein
VFGTTIPLCRAAFEHSARLPSPKNTAFVALEERRGRSSA